MIDFNWTEIFVLAVLAVIMFGPEKLPEFARKAARVLAYLRRIGEDARGQLRGELGPEFDDFHLSDLNPKNFVTRHLLSADEKEDLLAIRDEVRGTGQAAGAALGDVRSTIESVGATSPPDLPSLPTERAVRFDSEAT